MSVVSRSSNTIGRMPFNLQSNQSKLQKGYQRQYWWQRNKSSDKQTACRYFDLNAAIGESPIDPLAGLSALGGINGLL